jgi:hypothetical protein
VFIPCSLLVLASLFAWSVCGGGSEALQMSLTTHLKIQKSFFLPFSKRFGFE